MVKKLYYIFNKENRERVKEFKNRQEVEENRELGRSKLDLKISD